MEFAKITLTPTSSFITPLQSDTLFGHFAWAYAYRYGQSKLEEILKNFDEEPFIIFSDGFLQGFLPRPFLKPITFECNRIDTAKRIRKVSLVQKEFLLQNLDDLTEQKIVDHLQNLELPPISMRSITQKNSIDRDSHLVTEGLYTIKESFFYPDVRFEIYFAYQKIDQQEIEETFKVLVARGYGKDKSTGKGRFEFVIEWDFKEKRYFTLKKSKYINLSTMFYDHPSKMQLLYGKTITKFPKCGGTYAHSEPFKNPCIMFVPGSTFLINGNSPYGTALESVYNKPKHFQNGFSIGIYFDGDDR